MITRILLFGLIIAGLSSCATYRTGQTPDDVYYSPEREAESYVQTERDEDGRTTYNDNSEDRRIRQQIRDQRFRNFDDDYYWNSPRYNNGWGWNNWNNTWSNNCCCNSNFGHGFGYGYNRWGWNNWNSPYIFIPGTYSTIVIGGPIAAKNSTGFRYSAPIQRFNTTTTSNGKFINTGNGSRYFGGSSNNNNGGGRRTSFFGGGSNNNSGSGSRTFGNNNSSAGSGSRTFSGGGGSNNSSSSGSTGGGSKSSNAGGRRN